MRPAEVFVIHFQVLLDSIYRALKLHLLFLLLLLARSKLLLSLLVGGRI